jgi:ankyrin repeat protein
MALLLIDDGRADVNFHFEHMMAPLFFAVKTNNVDVTAALLRHPHLNINIKTSYQSTPLHLAASFGCPTTMKLLINDGRLDVHATNREGKTAFDLVKMFDVLDDDEDEFKQCYLLLREL